MRAQSLSVCIPNKGCDKNCPYCVSQMTGMKSTSLGLMYSNITKVKNLAQAAQVSTVLFTSKGEPFINYNELLVFINEFRNYWTEVQTNGLWLSNNINIISGLHTKGLNIIAVSVDDLKFLTSHKNLFETIRSNGLVSRVTFNITDLLGKGLRFEDLVTICKDCKIHQMTLRNIVIPNYVNRENKQADWIKEHVDPEMYKQLRREMITECERNGYLLRNLEYGSKVFDYKGIAVSYSDYCIQDHNNGEDIRSLIFMEDGHVYTNWASDASILF